MAPVEFADWVDVADLAAAVTKVLQSELRLIEEPDSAETLGSARLLVASGFGLSSSDELVTNGRLFHIQSVDSMWVLSESPAWHGTYQRKKLLDFGGPPLWEEHFKAEQWGSLFKRLYGRASKPRSTKPH